MKKQKGIIVVLLPIMFFHGCIITSGTHVVVGDTHPATDVSQIKLYTKPPAKYEEIALISSESAHDFVKKQTLIDAAMKELKEQAAEVGANGILLQTVGDKVVGSIGFGSGTANAYSHGNGTGGSAFGFGTTASNVRTGKMASGIAIYVIEE